MTPLPSRSTRLVPPLLLTVGVVHLAATPVLQQGLAPLLSAGVLGAVGDDASREAAGWYVVSGLALIGLGDVARTSVRDYGQLPPHLGGWVLATGAVVTATMPASPGWIVMGIGALAIRAERRKPLLPRRPQPARS